MIYYQDSEVIIRDLQESDAQIITDGEIAQGWDGEGRLEKYLMRLKDRAEGRSVALAAEFHGAVAGYINIYTDSKWGAFAGLGYPEIVDFGVLVKYQRRGIGSRLMDAAEKIAGDHADTVFLGVGLHGGYGSAQRMYIKRGYIPDGSGVWYGGKVCGQYENCCNDDDLVLYLSKKLR
ncbi:MAG: GNAT family N-acetyltransferase [Lachnospiraceae bacterium]|nr:GNAT family N-acetyltransferase [Lachnospiraceae bacterium]